MSRPPPPWANWISAGAPQGIGQARDPEEEAGSLWQKTTPAYVPRYGWRVLHNGNDLAYAGGLTDSVQAGDEVALFPPGR